MYNKLLQYLMFILIITLLLCGCSKGTQNTVAGLVPLPDERMNDWKVPENLVLQGEDNTYRIVSQEGQATPMLELAAGGAGQIEFYKDNLSSKEALGNYRLQFLSTQGIGRIKVSAVKQNGEVLGVVGLVFTGPIPESTAAIKWVDRRYFTNYQGDWLEGKDNLASLLAKHIPGLDVSQADKLRLSVEVGQGQHVLIAKLENSINPAQALAIKIEKKEYFATLGDILTIQTEFQNTSKHVMQNTTVKLVQPEGFGIIPTDSGERVINLAPGEKCSLSWNVKAQRPHAVNFGQPWEVLFAINEDILPAKTKIAVRDPRPGKIFYVMTEDLEPIDSAGYAKAWGNADSWLQPQEFLVQMVNKAEALNHIAAKYGAKWTHYIAWPAIKAGEWAAGQSSTGKWNEAVSSVKESVKVQAAQGHEYALHMHTDYDPYLAGNLLSYNAKVDGIWANHLRHGWAHSVFTEGDFNTYYTRTGILFAYQKILDQLATAASQGQILTARAGSFDFGNGAQDEAVSTKAYRNVGLWGSSDADGNEMSITSGEYGREIYFAQNDDINKPADDFAKLGIVEFRPTPRAYISYDNQNALTMNNKADEGMAYFTEQGKVKPGVHGIIGFTHAMFMLGEGGWESTQGGQFQVLDEHLNYLKTSYIDKGVLFFGTGTELVKAYLDYYAPYPLAVYGKRLSSGFGVSEYEIEILGHDIPISSTYTHNVSLKYPLYLHDSTYRITVLKNGQPIYTTWGLPTPFNDVSFQVDDLNAAYTLKVYNNEFFYKIVAALRGIKTKLSK